MIHSFQSILDDIEKKVQPFDWTTDSGHEIQGVLQNHDNLLTLKINSKKLTKAINFEYIYRENGMGNKRILYPYDIRTLKNIRPTGVSESRHIEVFMLIDEISVKPPELSNHVIFTYDSFLWGRVPESTTEKDEFDELFYKLKQIKTSIGKITVGLDATESYSSHPMKTERRMDKINILIESNKQLSNKEILMWNTRFSQLLALIHKERVVLRAIQRGMDNILVPSLVQNYTEASYAFRNPVGLPEFVEVIQETLSTFVDSYDEIVAFIEDLVQYYCDYPLHPPDKLQLLRLFTSIEQCANYWQKKEGILTKKLTDEQKQRDEEFDVLLNQVSSNKAITKSIKIYLRDTAKKFYATSGSLSAAKHKITGLAKLLQEEYGEYNCLTNMSNVELILGMRNMIAHGYYKPEVKKAFYENRDNLGKDTEQCLRIYAFRALGASKEVVKKHKDPLMARQFNNL